MAEFTNENRGALFNNKRKEKDTHPDFTGKGNFNGTDFEVSAWKKKDRNGNAYISLSFKEPYRKPVPDPDPDNGLMSDLGSDWD